MNLHRTKKINLIEKRISFNGNKIESSAKSKGPKLFEQK